MTTGGITCYERDEQACDDPVCNSTGRCRLRLEDDPVTIRKKTTIKPTPWDELEKLAREIDPSLPDDLSNYEVRITINRDFQSVECELISSVGEKAQG